ncbi:lipocalin family protein [Sinisalibacter aestuarii]|uniref:Outer membrane lipoprotein Blc n=1 Tax=Sinisalibacter aestuarii TaxID=2949426 RepID=A0ABQ5LW71_9RHOB|nr:lipocalin family protein [Sinisalibacter aestuarii]GKY88596.1 membrane protein [Sinisalibacter aestuarii]
MRLPNLILAAAASLGLAGPAAAGYRDIAVPIGVAVNLDLKRYLGKWYEIARFPNRFERGCAGVTADYALRPDDRITVVNTCRKGGLDGPVEVAKGVAEPVAPGKLEVTFVPWLPFAKGDYWVLHVDPAYSFAVVGEPSGKTGWILARAPRLAPEKYDKAISVLQSMGYDTAKLERVAH